MTQKKKLKTAKTYRPAVYTAFLFLLLLLSLAGCRTKAPTPTIDFSHHRDGSRITEEELRAYQESVLSALLITEKDGALTGTHTGLFSTVVSLSLYDCSDKDLLKNCFSLLAEYETVLSRTMPGSELYTVNQNQSGSIEVSADLAELLSLGLSYRECSGNRFDITVAPLSDLWAFGSDSSAVPSPEAIAAACLNVDGSKVSLDGTQLTYPVGTKFDLGAVAKGWLADQLAVFLKEQGVESAMINLGGNTLALGEKPDGNDFRVGITMPFSGSTELAEILSVNNRSVVTSGIYERYFIEDGTLYHHLLDATTGYPAENALLSVTIVCESSAMADLLSTVCFLLGKEDGMTLIEDLNGHTEVSALFLTGTYDPETKQVHNLEYHYSDGFKKFIK